MLWCSCYIIKAESAAATRCLAAGAHQLVCQRVVAHHTQGPSRREWRAAILRLWTCALAQQQAPFLSLSRQTKRANSGKAGCFVQFLFQWLPCRSTASTPPATGHGLGAQIKKAKTAAPLLKLASQGYPAVALLLPTALDYLKTVHTSAALHHCRSSGAGCGNSCAKRQLSPYRQDPVRA